MGATRTAGRMVTRESWFSSLWQTLTGVVTKNRIILYIALVLTLSLIVELFDISFVGK